MLFTKKFFAFFAKFNNNSASSLKAFPCLCPVFEDAIMVQWHPEKQVSRNLGHSDLALGS